MDKRRTALGREKNGGTMPVFDVAGERRDEGSSYEVSSVDTNDVHRCRRVSTGESRSSYSARAPSMRTMSVFDVADEGSPAQLSLEW